MPVKPLPSVGVACAIVLISSTMLASPGRTQQPGQVTQQPGQMTQARVWIENRSRSEAVPVDLRDVNLDHPLHVQIINGELQHGPSNPVQVRPVRPLWEYQTVTLATGEEMAQKLNPLGGNGWETTGITSVSGQGTMVLLKRPR
jgi:hypothetical protein